MKKKRGSFFPPLKKNAVPALRLPCFMIWNMAHIIFRLNGIAF
ncbi:hypothetical protein CHCC19466_2793 [Bacillus licheniformis]|nr:hypothetical protein CHCC19466_2793 [Bacillus licheniformis]TWL75185.1 hypothetical protein CHCC15318_4542 [Bacillus licheniformis]